MTGNRFRYIGRILLTIILGILATALNIKAAAMDANPVTLFCAETKAQIDLINSVFALITAGITIVYIYFEIKKIRKELKK
jgi:DUF2075 family protein